MVASGVPLKDTTAPAVKPVPLTAKVNAGPPKVTVAGEMLVITGAGPVMVNVSALETRLPLLTEMDADPGCAMRLAPTEAVN